MRQSAQAVKRLFDFEIVAAEIGVCTGFNAMSMLGDMKIKMLYLIDPYEYYNDGNEHKAEPEFFKFVFTMTRPLHHKTCIIRYPSAFASTFFPMRLFDYVYIDGLHTYEGVKSDIECWYPLVKDGGVIAGHDYNTQHSGVKKAVDEFVEKNKIVQFTQFKDTDWMVIK